MAIFFPFPAENSPRIPLTFCVITFNLHCGVKLLFFRLGGRLWAVLSICYFFSILVRSVLVNLSVCLSLSCPLFTPCNVGGGEFSHFLAAWLPSVHSCIFYIILVIIFYFYLFLPLQHYYFSCPFLPNVKRPLSPPGLRPGGERGRALPFYLSIFYFTFFPFPCLCRPSSVPAGSLSIRLYPILLSFLPLPLLLFFFSTVLSPPPLIWHVTIVPRKPPS